MQSVSFTNFMCFACNGFTLDEVEYQPERLNRTGTPLNVNIIIGGAGHSRYRENAIASARIVNKVRPSLIFIAVFHLEHDCPLRDDLTQGQFKENTMGETIEEEFLFLKHLELEDTWFFGPASLQCHCRNRSSPGG